MSKVKFLKHPLLLIIGLSIGIKVAYLLFAFLSNGEEQQKKAPDISWNSYYAITKNHDSFWYERISEEWYSKKYSRKSIGFSHKEKFVQSEWAFFPLYPAANRTMMKSFNWSFNQSATLLSVLFSMLAFVVLYLLIKDLYDHQVALLTTVLVIIFPFHYYYSMMYTESLFLFFLCSSFYTLLKQRYFLSALAMSGLVLLRPNGVILLLPLFLFMLERKNWIDRWRLKIKPLFSKQHLPKLFAFVAPVVCMGIYMVYQYQMTGYPHAFSIAQEGWYRKTMFPLLALFREGGLAPQFNSIFTIAVMLFAIYLWKKLPLSFNILIWISILLPMTSGSVMSMPRFVSIIFPLFIGLSWIVLKKDGLLRIGVLMVALALHFVTFNYWLINHPFSF